MMIVSEDFKQILVLVSALSKCNEKLTGYGTKRVSVRMYSNCIVEVFVYHNKRFAFSTLCQFDIRNMKPVSVERFRQR